MALPLRGIRARCGGTPRGGSGFHGSPTLWDPIQVWCYAQGRLRSRQPPAPSPISRLLDSFMTPGSGGEGGESAAWRPGQERLRSRQPSAPDPTSGLLDSALTPGTDR
ncbi:unnamed protein product [Schistocephalus solidus]|uniref:Uncharacterized protein n=1 Tax=Schistocephalus solidus TaxID=70667 RepID=A0A183S8H2_SCHSO|nr:unnamed protein product [Schistocephalus solidus]